VKKGELKGWLKLSVRMTGEMLFVSSVTVCAACAFSRGMTGAIVGSYAVLYMLYGIFKGKSDDQ